MGKGRLKERCRLESQTNFFPFKKSPKTECGLDSDVDQIREYTVLRKIVHQVGSIYKKIHRKLYNYYFVDVASLTTQIDWNERHEIFPGHIS